MSDLVQTRLRKALVSEPCTFEFFQAVRLLERLEPEREPLGRFSDPGRECLRIHSNPDVAFPASEIQDFRVTGDEQPHMDINVMGLIGPLGVLPNPYRSLTVDRIRARDRSLAAFLDIFQHRAASFFFRAWQKYNLAVNYERAEAGRFHQYLRDFNGIGTEELENRQEIADQALVYYTGLLTMQPRSAQALIQIMEDFFGIEVDIVQFVGAWYPLPQAALCWLDREAQCSQLGLGAVAGDAVWEHQGRARIVLGPLPMKIYRQFLPGEPGHDSLEALLRFYCGGQFDFEVQLILKHDEVPGLVLGGTYQNTLPVGYGCWLKSTEMVNDPGDCVFELGG